jgi:F-type H+-transporting ATPase subunit b
MSFFAQPETWVLVSFLLFIALLMYFKVPGMVTKALDDRAAAIAKELEEAQKLREEAQAILADYQRRQRDAEKEAEGIVTQAMHEAERFAEEAQAKLQDSLERRTRMAEEKIGQAEAQALKDVRAAAADLAIAAAEKLISSEVSGKKADALISQSIKDVQSKLN